MYKRQVTDSLRLKQVVEKLKELKQCGSYISSSYEYLDHLEEFCIKHNRIPQKMCIRDRVLDMLAYQMP